jgi:hypothetical protein
MEAALHPFSSSPISFQVPDMSLALVPVGFTPLLKSSKYFLYTPPLWNLFILPPRFLESL